MKTMKERKKMKIHNYKNSKGHSINLKKRFNMKLNNFIQLFKEKLEISRKEDNEEVQRVETNFQHSINEELPNINKELMELMVKRNQRFTFANYLVSLNKSPSKSFQISCQNIYKHEAHSEIYEGMNDHINNIHEEKGVNNDNSIFMSSKSKSVEKSFMKEYEKLFPSGIDMEMNNFAVSNIIDNQPLDKPEINKDSVSREFNIQAEKENSISKDVFHSNIHDDNISSECNYKSSQKETSEQEIQSF